MNIERTECKVLNYKKIYDAIVERAKNRASKGYVERHHINPKCMGGSDDPDNLVALTPEEHFLAHVLLVKIFPEEKNLILAVQKMSVSSKFTKSRRSRKLYGWLRRKHAERMRELSVGEKNAQFGSRWINDGTVSKKLKRGEPLPKGWTIGRLKKYKNCKSCDTTITGNVKYCGPCRDAAYRTNKNNKGKRLRSAKASLIDIQKSLLANNFDINLSMASLGYKPNQYGYTRNTFITQRDALVSQPPSKRSLTE